MPEKIDKLFKVFLSLTIAVLFLSGAIVFEKKEVIAAGESDAIAVRVLPNPSHLGALDWYNSQGFKGNPTPLSVDGYDAVQDGRTIYVNAANVALKCNNYPYSGNNCLTDDDCGGLPDSCVIGSQTQFYTNIYLISYNQEATPETIAIFNNLISKWKFNTNLSDTGVCFGRATDDKVCSTNKDCADGTICNSGKCAAVCLADSDCPNGGFCSSLKGRVVRDTKRLAEVVGLKKQIEAYSRRVGHYPLLGSGTYLVGKSISVWPSWQGEFAAELGFAPPVDPINKLGDCGAPPAGGQYDPITCWDNKTKTFADPNPDDNVFDLPAGSRALVYTTDAKGKGFEACAVMESGLLLGDDQGACLGSYTAAALAEIKCGNLVGIQNQEFVGYVTVSDPQNDHLAITITPDPSNPSGGDFAFVNTTDPYKKEIHSANSPATGNFSFTVGYGSVQKICTVNISSNANIIYPIADQKIAVSRDLTFSVYANNSKKDYTGVSFAFSGVSGMVCAAKPSITADGRVKCDVKYNSSAQIAATPVTVTVTNTAGDQFTSQTFKLEVYNNPPVIQGINCAKSVRVGDFYSCTIKATDPDGDPILTWSADPATTLSGLGLGISSTGVFSGTPNKEGIYTVSFTAYDRFLSPSNPVDFTPFKVNTYCGDGLKQSPNSEGKGGPDTFGNENCDCGKYKNEDGSINYTQCVRAGGCTNVLSTASQCDQANSLTGVPTSSRSSLTWQYGCSNTCSSQDGGYCGDGAVQDGRYNDFKDRLGIESLNGANGFNFNVTHGKIDFGEQCDFSADNNCCSKCSWTTGPTEEVSIEGDKLLKNIDPNNIMSLGVPSCRGVTGGTFDVTLRPYGEGYGPDTGPTIIFITDISGSMFDPTYSITSRVMQDIIGSLSDQATTKHVNIHVGAIATYGNAVQKRVEIGNLNGSGGTSQRDALLSSIGTYALMSDPPNFAAAFDTARTMMGSYANAAPNEKYIIFLTDGYPSGAQAQAKAARDAGIKVYVAAFNNWDQRFNSGALDLATCTYNLCNSLRSICSWSNDNGDLNVCFKNINVDNSINSAFTGYTFYVGNKSGTEPINPPAPALVGSRLASIYNNIVTNILTRVPTNVKYTIAGGAQSGSLTNFIGVAFTLPQSIIKCDPSGRTGCTPGTFVLKADFTGTGQVQFNNFKLNIVPLCKN